MRTRTSRKPRGYVLCLPHNQKPINMTQRVYQEVAEDLTPKEIDLIRRMSEQAFLREAQNELINPKKINS